MSAGLRCEKTTPHSSRGKRSSVIGAARGADAGLLLPTPQNELLVSYLYRPLAAEAFGVRTTRGWVQEVALSLSRKPRTMYATGIFIFIYITQSIDRSRCR
mgnify:CR=1 FL=1